MVVCICLLLFRCCSLGKEETKNISKEAHFLLDVAHSASY
uniref:Uncharacterized protein n=1 Tax=Triticum urartu TaxID=4572 RepID=A0A8R7PEV6_TRIUA